MLIIIRIYISLIRKLLIRIIYSIQEKIEKVMQNEMIGQRIARLKRSFYPISKKRTPMVKESYSRQSYAKTQYSQFSRQYSTDKQKTFNDKKTIYNEQAKQTRFGKITRAFTLNKQTSTQINQRQDNHFPSGRQQQEKSQLDKILIARLRKINEQKLTQFSPKKTFYVLEYGSQTCNNRQQFQREYQSQSQKHFPNQYQQEKIARKSSLYILSVIRRQKLERKQRAKLVQKIANEKSQREVLINIKSTNLSPKQSCQLIKCLNGKRNKSTARITSKVSRIQSFKQNKQVKQSQICWKSNCDQLKNQLNSYTQKDWKINKKILHIGQARKQQKSSINNENINPKTFQMNYFDDFQDDYTSQINKISNRLPKTQKLRNIENLFENIKIEPW